MKKEKILLLIITMLLVSLTCWEEVKAETIKVDHHFVTINDSNWYTNYGYYGMNFNTSGTGFNFKIQMTDTKFDINNDQQYIDPEFFTLVATDFCLGSSINKLERYNNYGDSCPNSCYTQTPFYVYLGTTCKYDNTHEGFLYRLYFPILRWQKLADGSLHYYIINDKMKITPTSYNTTGTFTNVYLTNELPIPDSIDTINAQINALNSTSHQDSINTQNAINSQTQQQQQNHNETMNADYTGTTEQPNMTDYNTYETNEETLLNVANGMNLNSIAVGIDGTSSTKIWEIITRLFQSNAIVFTMLLSILSIGVIKLMLNR